VTAHPDWWIQTLAGEPFTHSLPLGAHQLKVVDLTHPDARAWAIANLTALETAGVDFFKLDYLYAGALDGRRVDPTATGVSALSLGLQAVFAGLQRASVNLCGVPWLHGALAPPSTMRVGTDVALNGAPSGFVFVATAARDLSARAFGPISRRADPDQFLLQPMSPDETRTALILQALAGETFALSDDLTMLTQSQTEAVFKATGLQLVSASGNASIAPRGVFDSVGSEVLGTTLGELLSAPNHVESHLPAVLTRGEFLAATNWGDESASIDLHLRAGEQPGALWGPDAADGKVTLPSHATGLYVLKR
jgi:hypothetical protein